MGYFVEVDKNQHPDFAIKGKKPKGPALLDDHNRLGLKPPVYAWIGEQEIIPYADRTKLSRGSRSGDVWKDPSGTATKYYSQSNCLNGITFIARIRRDSTQDIVGGKPYPASGWSSPFFEYGAWITSGGLWNWRIAGSDDDFATVSTTELETHCTVCDGVNWKHYKNAGETNSVVNSALPSNTNSRPIHIGQNQAGSEQWAGDIEYIFIFDYPLSAEQVKAIYHDPYEIFKPAVPLEFYTPSVGGVVTNPKGPFFHPFFGPFRGPIS